MKDDQQDGGLRFERFLNIIVSKTVRAKRSRIIQTHWLLGHSSFASISFWSHERRNLRWRSYSCLYCSVRPQKLPSRTIDLVVRAKIRMLTRIHSRTLAFHWQNDAETNACFRLRTFWHWNTDLSCLKKFRNRKACKLLTSRGTLSSVQRIQVQSVFHLNFASTAQRERENRAQQTGTSVLLTNIWM